MFLIRFQFFCIKFVHPGFSADMLKIRWKSGFFWNFNIIWLETFLIVITYQFHDKLPNFTLLKQAFSVIFWPEFSTGFIFAVNCPISKNNHSFRIKGTVTCLSFDMPCYQFVLEIFKLFAAFIYVLDTVVIRWSSNGGLLKVQT